MDLTLAEQETHLNMSADNRGVWHVYSDDPVMQRKLESIGAVFIRTSSFGVGKHYDLPANQITFRQPPKPLSDERKAQLADRLRAMRQTPIAMGAVDSRIDSENGGR